jgi:hypothetical protein
MLTTTKLNQKCKKTELSMILYSPTEMVFLPLQIVNTDPYGWKR